MEDEFKREVIERLVKIETKIDGYAETKKVAYEAHKLAENNKTDIVEIQDKMSWLSKAIGGAVITGIAGIVFLYFKIGLGVS